MLRFISNLFRRSVNEPAAPERFKTYHDAMLYMGKPVVGYRVEMPDVRGYLTGVFFDMFGGIPCGCRLLVNDELFHVWQVGPDKRKNKKP